MNRLADTNVWNDPDPLGDGSDYGVTGQWWGSDTRPNLFDTLAAENVQRDAASHYRRQAYKLRLQKMVRSFCLAVAVFAIVWIGGLELIGLVK